MTACDEEDELDRIRAGVPAGLKLVDNHVHTELAYCSENMTVEKAIARARAVGLAGLTFTEHAGQLYFDRKPYWGNVWLEQGLDGAEVAHNRMPEYLALKRAHEDDFARFSLEVECDMRGNLLLKPEDRAQFDWVMGTIHALSDFNRETPPQQSHLDQFLFLVESMGKAGIRVLAHPMRIFRRAEWDAPPALFEPTAKLLRKYAIAAEINFHTNIEPVGFLRSCLDHGVKVSFGSDSHNLAEVGDFGQNIALLREAGYDGDIKDVVLDAR
jgi:histidinol phosphatase-like PHP family hydrolase